MGEKTEGNGPKNDLIKCEKDLLFKLLWQGSRKKKNYLNLSFDWVFLTPSFDGRGVNLGPPYFNFICENNRKSNKIMHCVEDMGIFHVFHYLSVMDRYSPPPIKTKLKNVKKTTTQKKGSTRCIILLLSLLFSQI